MILLGEIKFNAASVCTNSTFLYSLKFNALKSPSLRAKTLIFLFLFSSKKSAFKVTLKSL